MCFPGFPHLLLEDQCYWPNLPLGKKQKHERQVHFQVSWRPTHRWIRKHWHPHGGVFLSRVTSVFLNPEFLIMFASEICWTMVRSHFSYRWRTPANILLAGGGGVSEESGARSPHSTLAPGRSQSWSMVVYGIGFPTLLNIYIYRCIMLYILYTQYFMYICTNVMCCVWKI